MLVKRAFRVDFCGPLSSPRKKERKSVKWRKRGDTRGWGTRRRAVERPSLRDVNVAPGARLRRQRAHMGFADRTQFWGKGWKGGLKGRWMPDDIMTDGNVSVCFSYVETRNEGIVVERVSFSLAVHFRALHDRAQCWSFASSSIIRIRSHLELGSVRETKSLGKRIILLRIQRHLMRV